MANVVEFNGGSLALSDMGFVNVPDGKWVFRSGSKSISANSDSYIPLAVASCGTSFGGKTVGSTWTHGDYWRWDSSRTNYNVFLPHLFGWDCAQLKALSGTFTLWLEKVG